jgi:Family of unknown function (DUF6111)
MTRVFFTMVVPLLLPTALYLLWCASVGRGAFAAGAGNWRGTTWAWLAGAGVMLAAAVLVTVVETSGARDGRYVPPHEENGQIVPGHVVPADR